MRDLLRHLSLLLVVAGCTGSVASETDPAAFNGAQGERPGEGAIDRTDHTSSSPGNPSKPGSADDATDPALQSDAGALPIGSDSPADASIDVPVSNAAVADDFEGPSLDAALWTVRGFEGSQMATPTTATVDSTRAHTGKQSVLIRDGFLEAKVPASAFYGRLYTWFDADPGTGHWMSIAALAPGNGRDTEVRYGGHYGILQANYYGNDDEVISDPKGYCAPTCDNGVTMPVGRWACVEVYYGPDEMRLWLDGEEIETLHVREWRNQKAPWSPAYDRVRVGFHNFQGSAPQVWLDDVAFDSARIGCR